jgi:hypothetical protein
MSARRAEAERAVESAQREPYPELFDLVVRVLRRLDAEDAARARAKGGDAA